MAKEPDLRISDELIEAFTNELSNSSPAKIAQVSSELKKEARAKARKAKQNSLTHTTALGKVGDLRRELDRDFGAKVVAAAIAGEASKEVAMKSWDNSTWAMMVMDMSKFIPEEEMMRDPSFYDSTLSSIFTHQILTKEMVDALGFHLAVIIHSYREGLIEDELKAESEFVAAKPVNGGTKKSSKSVHQEFESSMLPDWGTF